ncbi:uncharacterized protein BYT42DRAFT_586716 [Radiomyces spectabilis]|uniref:uncharacterized protein n=1 Tax=Radiomyces spectabilis TaxID=64574 RepID=UPI00221F238E|nr:uncharacterized protein BYT42DRAFT_586716 [Radiomyces spectabilis]KAI8367561.1 hypothetical protein BYT42DRAFT_586716 [Radiomyces spectabilis]
MLLLKGLGQACLRRQFLRAHSVAAWRHFVSVSPNVTVSGTKKPSDTDDYLRLIFDDKTVWNQHRILSQSRQALEEQNDQRSVGLFENPDLINAEGFHAAAQRAIQRAQFMVERIARASENGPDEMRKVVKNLDRLSDTLCSVIDMAEFLRNAHPDGEVMEAANQAYADLCSYMNTLNTDTRIHRVLAQVLADKSIVAQFTADEHAAAIVFMRDFEKSGIHLPDARRAQFVKLSDRIIELGREFIQRNPRGIHQLKLQPSSVKALGPSFARSLTAEDGFVYLSTDSAECQMVLKYTENDQIRKQVYEAMNSANRESVIILELLMQTRAELAALVGQDSFAELQLQDKMAKNPNNVNAFLRTLLQHQAPSAQHDIHLLQQTKQQALHLSSPPTVNAWDRDYYMHLYNVSHQLPQQARSLTPYFSVGSVIQGLSRLFDHLYGVHFEPAYVHPGEAWHEDVHKLDVVCEREGKIGIIYCDLFGRPRKTTNAAHYTVRTSRRVDDDDAANDIRYAFPDQPETAIGCLAPPPEATDTIRGREGRFQLPIIALTCDFSHGTSHGGPPLLSMFEVETLFHEMGHAMHSMLGRTDFHNVAGTRCATDFVELPSILMEHFVWHPKVLPLFARDHRTGEHLSLEGVNAFLAQRKRFGGLEVNSQILMALLDQAYHSADAGRERFSSVKVWHDLQNEVGMFPSVPGTMWPVQFGHLFGYGAGYYSYLFDRTLARRVWQTCFEQNPLDREKGQAFRDNLLKWGGARDPWQCVAHVLGGEDGDRIIAGDEGAMRAVGDWGIDV